jgi:hypothetical protein
LTWSFFTTKNALFFTRFLMQDKVSCKLPLRVIISSADGHGYLQTPRSRNFVASQEGKSWGAGPTDPAPEYCPHCLNVVGRLETPKNLQWQKGASTFLLSSLCWPVALHVSALTHLLPDAMMPLSTKDRNVVRWGLPTMTIHPLELVAFCLRKHKPPILGAQSLMLMSR